MIDTNKNSTMNRKGGFNQVTKIVLDLEKSSHFMKNTRPDQSKCFILLNDSTFMPLRVIKEKSLRNFKKGVKCIHEVIVAMIFFQSKLN